MYETRNGVVNMKIKSDFVTNSSSTSYIIYLPENFDVLNTIKEKKPELLDRLSSEKNKLFLNDVIEKAKKDSEVPIFPMIGLHQIHYTQERIVMKYLMYFI